MNPLHEPFPADGFHTAWSTWDGSATEQLSLQWDNEGWTASGIVGSHSVQYVIRLSPLWQVRQFLLFRDLDEPDLWLGTDGHSRWGEVNGAHRVDLDGGIDIELAITPFTFSIPIRRMALQVGQEASTVLLDVDVDTLGVVPVAAQLRRLDTGRYELERASGVLRLDVDEHGLVLDLDDAFRRI